MFSRLASIPTTQCSVKETAESARSLVDCRTFFTIIGLNTFSSKWPFEPPTVTATCKLGQSDDQYKIQIIKSYSMKQRQNHFTLTYPFALTTQQTSQVFCKQKTLSRLSYQGNKP